MLPGIKGLRAAASRMPAIAMVMMMGMIVAFIAASRHRLCFLRRGHRSLRATGLVEDFTLCFELRLTGICLHTSVNPFAGATIAAD